jgi:hypothetical protein
MVSPQQFFSRIKKSDNLPSVGAILKSAELNFTHALFKKGVGSMFVCKQALMVLGFLVLILCLAGYGLVRLVTDVWPLFRGDRTADVAQATPIKLADTLKNVGPYISLFNIDPHFPRNPVLTQVDFCPLGRGKELHLVFWLNGNRRAYCFEDLEQADKASTSPGAITFKVRALTAPALAKM